jgi:hypothetical protein
LAYANFIKTSLIGLPYSPSNFVGLFFWDLHDSCSKPCDSTSYLKFEPTTTILNDDDETLPIINKLKHPKKGLHKEQNGRTHVQEDKITT